MKDKEPKGVRCAVCDAHVCGPFTATGNGWYLEPAFQRWFCPQHNPTTLKFVALPDDEKTK